MITLLMIGCGQDFAKQSLEPYPNPNGPSTEPRRGNPMEIVASGGVAWVSLQGSPDEPGNEVVRIELTSGEMERIEVGSSPTGLVVHPSGEAVVVFNRFSNFLAVIDTKRLRVHEVEVDFYAIEGVFSPDGDELWFTNRWHDTVVVLDVAWDGRRLEVLGRDEPGIPVGGNPRDIAISGDTIAVAALTGGSVSILDRQRREEVFRVDLGAPANGLAFVDDLLVVATTSASTHHVLAIDGTPNINFQDLQNELAVIDPVSGEVTARYTSDSICCADYRDVQPDDVEGIYLPPEETWIVGGALPEQIAVDGSELFVSYSASNEVQRFTMDAGALHAGPTWKTRGHAPHGIAVVGGEVLVAHRLGETVGRYDANGSMQQSYAAGELDAGSFPATDAEVGELFNTVTAPFTVDGDQSCTHCHREGGNIDKAFSMPLTLTVGEGSRMTMSYRGALDSRPWFFEGAFDETNFKPVMNEFARIENFCCTDYTLWTEGAPADCEANPPSACADYPTPYPTRDSFYLAASEAVVGRTESYGDRVYYEDLFTGRLEPVPLNFQGITQSLGAFLLTDTNLLPNPEDPQGHNAARGKAIFERADVGCAVCHPAPAFAVTSESNPYNVPLRMGPVITPKRADGGTNLDLLASGFVETFPLAEQDSCEDVCGELCDEDGGVCDEYRDVRFNVPPLRGIWDRAPSMLHDGRAKSLREVLCTPGHPALQAGEVGYNENDGIPDTHGGTSHLSPSAIEDLIAYLETL